MSVISMVLVVIVAFLAGMEGVLDEFQFHHEEIIQDLTPYSTFYQLILYHL